MENLNFLDVVALAAQLQAVACEENEILDVSYSRFGTSVGPEVSVHVSNYKMVDMVSENAELHPFSINRLKYCAKIRGVEVFTLLTNQEAVYCTGKSYMEIAQLLEDAENGDDLC